LYLDSAAADRGNAISGWIAKPLAFRLIPRLFEEDGRLDLLLLFFSTSTETSSSTDAVDSMLLPRAAGAVTVFSIIAVPSSSKNVSVASSNLFCFKNASSRFLRKLFCRCCLISEEIVSSDHLRSIRECQSELKARAVNQDSSVLLIAKEIADVPDQDGLIIIGEALFEMIESFLFLLIDISE
jgi:hypothetical protein